MDFATLEEFLKWLMGPGGAVVGYWLMENVTVLVNLKPRIKRYVGFVLPGGLAAIGWMLLASIGYAPMPTTTLARFEALFAVFVAAVGAQLIHAKNLPKNKPCDPACCDECN
jgi:hypothetical protein